LIDDFVGGVDFKNPEEREFLLSVLHPEDVITEKIDPILSKIIEAHKNTDIYKNSKVDPKAKFAYVRNGTAKC